MASRSKRLAHIYDMLPGTSQREFVRTQLFPLLNTLPTRKSKRILRRATRRLRKYQDMPTLDLQSKKTEVNGLLDELSKDIRTSVPPSCVVKDELLKEAVESVAEWLNDIWVVAYEYGAEYMKAHSCLLFSLGILDHVRSMQESCRCTSTSVYFPITIKRSNGKVVRTFTGLGVRNVEDAVLWIWRDVFLALLSSEDKYITSHVPEMLSDIDDILAWEGLKWMFSGSGEDESDDNDLGNYSDSGVEGDTSAFRSCIGDDDTTDCDHHHHHHHRLPCRSDSSNSTLSVQPPWEPHWPRSNLKYHRRLRRHVIDHLIGTFKIVPCVDLYRTIIDLDLGQSEETKRILFKHLEKCETSTSAALGAALEIYSLEGKRDRLTDLIRRHIYLLNPKDAAHLMTAVRYLATIPLHMKLAHKTIETEVYIIARCVHHALLGAFPRLEDPVNRAAIRDLVRLPADSVTRQERVESWVNAVMMSNDLSMPEFNDPTLGGDDGGNDQPNLLAETFAGFAMGLGAGILDPVDGGGGFNADNGAFMVGDGMAGGNADGGEMLGLFGMGMGVGLGINMADMSMNAQLLEEWQRPNMKDRFEQWTQLAREVPQGLLVLDKVYRRMIDLMPYLHATDLVNEMVTRIINRPTKFSACVTLESINIFVKAQRKRLSEIRAKKKGLEKKKVPASSSAPTPVSTSPASTSTSTSTSATSPAPTPTSAVTTAPEVGSSEPTPRLVGASASGVMITVTATPDASCSTGENTTEPSPSTVACISIADTVETNPLVMPSQQLPSIAERPASTTTVPENTPSTSTNDD